MHRSQVECAAATRHEREGGAGGGGGGGGCAKLRRTFPVWIKKLTKRISLCLHLINIVDGPQIGQQHCQHRHSLNYLWLIADELPALCVSPLSLSRSLSVCVCVYYG